MSETLYHAEVLAQRAVVSTGITVFVLSLLMVAILALKPQPTGPPMQDVTATPDDQIVEVEAGEFSEWTDAPGILVDVSLSNDE